MERSFALDDDKYCLDVLDYYDFPDKNEVLSAAILRLNKERKGFDHMLYILRVQNEELGSLKQLLVTRSRYTSALNQRLNFDGTFSTITPGKIWRLQHDAPIICAGWNESAAKNAKFLVASVTTLGVVFIWNCNFEENSFEVCTKIDIGQHPSPGLKCSWIHTNGGLRATCLEQIEYLILHESTFYLVHSITGLYSGNMDVNAHLIMKNHIIELPENYNRIIRVHICGRLIRTGLVTLYTSQTQRPAKTISKMPFKISKWVTLKSFKTNEASDSIVGAQIAVAVTRMLPPCYMDVVTNYGLTSRVYIMPVDFVIRDVPNEDVVGVAVRYCMYAESPLYLRQSDQSAQLGLSPVPIQEALFIKIKSDPNVDKCQVLNNHHYMKILMATRGRMEMIVTARFNPSVLECRTIALECADPIVDFYSVDSGSMLAILHSGSLGLYSWNDSIDDWEACINFKIENHSCIRKFGFWYAGGPMYIICQDGNEQLTLYIIKNKMGWTKLKWLIIKTHFVENVLTGTTHALGNWHTSPLFNRKYELSMECHFLMANGEDGVNHRLFLFAPECSDSEPSSVLPVYHPCSITALLQLGLCGLVNNMLIQIYQSYLDFFNILADSTYCKLTQEECPCHVKKLCQVNMTQLNRKLLQQSQEAFYNINFGRNRNAPTPCQTLVDQGHCQENKTSNDYDTTHTSAGSSTSVEVPIEQLLEFMRHIELPGVGNFQNQVLMELIRNICPHQQTTSEITDLNGAPNNVDSEPQSQCMLVSMAGEVLNRVKAQPTRTLVISDYPIMDATQKSRADDFCLERFLQFAIRSDCSESNQIVWAILCQDDCFIFQNVLRLIDTGDPLATTNELVGNMKRLGMGFWISSDSCMDLLVQNLDAGFKRLVASSGPTTPVTDFDAFAFWSILRSKSKVYGHILKLKGHEKMGEFFNRDFDQETNQNAAVKNAYSLISQRRYLLACGFLILARKIEDAISIAIQYLDDYQLGMLICKYLKHPLETILNKMPASRIKGLLMHRVCNARLELETFESVEDLVYGMHVASRFAVIDPEILHLRIREFSALYSAKGLDHIALMLIEMVPTNLNPEWREIFCEACKQHIKETELENGLLFNMPEESTCISQAGHIEYNWSRISNFGSEISESLHEHVESPRINYHKQYEKLVAKVENLHFVLDSSSDVLPSLASCLIGWLEMGVDMDMQKCIQMLITAILEFQQPKQQKDALPVEFMEFAMVSTLTVLLCACFRGECMQANFFHGIEQQMLAFDNLLNKNNVDIERYLKGLVASVEPLILDPDSTIHACNKLCIRAFKFSILGNDQRHEYLSCCIVCSILETIIGLAKNFLEHCITKSVSITRLGWIDRLCSALEMYLWDLNKSNFNPECYLASAKAILPMLNVNGSLGCDSLLSEYITSVYGNEFGRLWNLLQCEMRTRDLYAPYEPMQNLDLNCKTPESDNNFQNHPIPLVTSIEAVLAPLEQWTNEHAQAMASQQKELGPHAKVATAIIDKIQQEKFTILNNFKCRLNSLHTIVPVSTLHASCANHSCKTLLEPFLGTLCQLVLFYCKFGTKMCSINTFGDALVQQVHGACLGICEPMASVDTFCHVLKLVAAHGQSILEHTYDMRKEPRALKNTEGFFKRLAIRQVKPEVHAAGPSGGIIGHGTWPIYALVYGQNDDPQAIPQYLITLEHGLVDKHRSPSCSTYGNICTLEWLDESLALCDCNGWYLVYILTKILYLEHSHDQYPIAVPTICFRAHVSAVHATWLGPRAICTMGVGILQADINNARIISAKKSEDGDVVESLERLKSELGSVWEHVPCVAIWDITQHASPNVPMLKTVIIGNVHNAGFFTRKRSKEYSFTQLLSIPSKSSDIPIGLAIFDSEGHLQFYCSISDAIVLECQLHEAAIFKALWVKDNKFVTVGTDGTANLWQFETIETRPMLISSTNVLVNCTDEAAPGNFVYSIGEYFGITIPSSQRQGAFSNIAHVHLDGKNLYTSTIDGLVGVVQLDI
ncbi:bifunctional RAVE complex protein Rav1 C-terminal/WD40 repeat/WD40-repeat-containing domain superfamily [Babesia duncani]|uniref:Bifunctional RAVE complex protein Rav1 C-terminal/WD40 repeat/WD40-repeat-containing domain superfamily n=1 Tax=Babesia duncani TaxID=323732 RepID=A0AAD9UNS7_9APIC|nr:bifunctional RAVE complex protein Rav1 C-terminal/WD40 repeat/WD40-repeat-containing domain superfamily [Babesia duncani]